MLRSFLYAAAVAFPTAAIAGSGVPLNPPSHVIPVQDALGILASNMGAGTWQKLHEETGQSGGIRSTIPPQDAPTTYDVPGFPLPWPTRAPTDGSGRTLLCAWNGGALVDKPNQHVRFYMPGGGGHGSWAGNAIYSFDLLDAANAVNRGLRLGQEQYWQRISEPARLVEVHDGTNPTGDPFNQNGPYLTNETTDLAVNPVTHSMYDPADPLGLDQCHVGPASTHTYGGVAYAPWLDAIIVYGVGQFRLGGNTPRGIWLVDIEDQQWTLLPADRDDVGNDCRNATAGDLLFDAFRSSTSSNISLIVTGQDRIWLGNRYNAYRWRTDNNPWTVRPETFPGQDHAQRTGGLSTTPSPIIVQPPGIHKAIGAPYGANLAGWIFYIDNGAGGSPLGFAAIYPDIDVDDALVNQVFVEYDNNMPNDGVNIWPDVTSGVWSDSKQLFFFIHKPWLADFKGQVYAFDPVSRQWSTYIDPLADPSNPSRAIDWNLGCAENGTWGRFAYMEDRNLFLLVFDSGAFPTGYTGQVYLLKGI